MIDSARKPPDNRIHLFDPVGLINDSYASHVIRPPRRPARAPESPVRFAVETDSGGSSPRLWNTTPSPDSRTQAIARGRKEMMEMIKDLPESSYELSLRDIVDQKSPAKAAAAAPAPIPSGNMKPKAVSRNSSKKKVARSRSVDNGGFLIKTSVFPISFWLRKKDKKKLGSKRKSGVMSEGENGGSSSGSSDNSRNNSLSARQEQGSRFLAGCFSFKSKKTS